MNWTHLRDETPIARKDYLCVLCGLVIAKGEKHLVRTGFHESLESFRMHAACEKKTRGWDAETWESCYECQDEFRKFELADCHE